jgi:nuclear pore complex protein Nup93
MATTGTLTGDPKEVVNALPPPAMALLSELLESSRNLPNASSDLGSIQLGLREIASRAGKLRKTEADENDTKAHYLLAGSGVNAEDIASEVQSIMFHTSLESTTFTSNEPDIDSYLRIKKEENILASIEGSVRSTAREFDVFLAQNVTLDWKTRKTEICEHFGLVPKKSEPSAAKSKGIAPTWGKTTLGRLILGEISGTSALDSQPKNAKHAEVVAELNSARLDGRAFPLAHAFANVVQNYGADTRSQQIHDSWKIVAYIAQEHPKEPLPARKYAKQYILADKQSAEAIGLRRQIVRGSRRYLEEQFFQVIESEIAKYPQDAQLGGVPSVYNKVKAYLNLKFLKGGKWTRHNLEIVNNVPVWALLYYMVRSGHLEDALDFTLQVGNSFKKIERSFPIYLKAFIADPNHVLPRDLLERLHTEFNQHIRFFDEDADPFKYALYKLLGRCELSRKAFPEVITTTEDWLWVHLMLTREGENEINPLHERYGLLDLQRVVIQFGAKHFSPNKNTPALYFQVLLLAGLFEWAVHYAYSFSQVDAVDFAIALTYYGLLRPVTDIEKMDAELLLLDKDENPQLDFVRLIGHYTREFRRSDPCDAVDYLVQICLNGTLPSPVGKKHLQMCHEALKELVLETREFSRLLGDIRADGTRQSGAIESKMQLIQINDSAEFLHAITEQAALQANEYGRTADSILLYQLSDEYDTVVSIINKSLGEFLSLAEIGKPMSSLPTGVPLMLSATEDPAKLARSMMEVYASNPVILSKVSQRNRETCTALLQMVNARDLFAHGQWEPCVKEIEATGILTLSPDADVGSVKRRAQRFSGLHESIARNVPSLLIMVMKCLVNIGQSLNQSMFSNSGRTSKVAELRARARNCMIYAGMIQYRMPREVYSQLTSLEILV